MTAAPKPPPRRKRAEPGQHFLLSGDARSLPLARVFRMTETQAYNAFRRARWPDGQPFCPHCGCVGAYEHAPRKVTGVDGQKRPARPFSNRFSCKQRECRREFSVTTGTILAHRKLPFRTLLQAVALSAQSVKGKAALQLSRELSVQYKTAWVLSHKLREAIAAERAEMKLSGTVELDGMYVGGHQRPANRRDERVDRRKQPNPARQCVMALRQRGGRILATVVPGEQGAPAMDLVRRHVQAPAELRADEAPGYNDLVALYPMQRNNHGEAYVVEPGASTNQVESFFSRVRRSAQGIHHRVAGTYLDWYVSDLAFREDMRRMPMAALAGRYLGSALTHPVSRNVAGYWQGNRPRRVLGWQGPWGDDGGGGGPEDCPPRRPGPAGAAVKAKRRAARTFYVPAEDRALGVLGERRGGAGRERGAVPQVRGMTQPLQGERAYLGSRQRARRFPQRLQHRLGQVRDAFDGSASLARACDGAVAVS